MEIQGKINTLLDPYSNTANLEKSGEARLKGRASATPPEGSQGDTVSVSQDALLLTEARRTAQNTPDVRAEKVEALRIQVSNGTYKPDSKLIAANLVREEPGLFR
ncbi:flagellar biosynthesis anti-sigma factor FlgM [Desulfovibrio sp. UIB00]|uniref:flagellar biosynthesis anti-sigma factor FlgM n=1 Tax=Desulfovibrio sp. UIB00 TaxID=2804314 RepID=UPI001F0DD195|nr:flagellar biosynthesis anti-sigma factor FlgM [Desulfovibrio sp. UIB00]MCH5144005.1 flagellar biosynthesis anti-sigma factor FlgM [Desulfovibrio sp. UIB00]